MPGEQWGETPVAFVVRTQRLAHLECVDELPRSAIGKVLKRDLRDGWIARQRDFHQ